MEEFLKHAAEREALHQTEVDRAARNVIEVFDQRYIMRPSFRIGQVWARFVSRGACQGTQDTPDCVAKGDRLVAEIDHLDPAARSTGWHPVPLQAWPDAGFRSAFVSFATTWADIVTPVRLFRYNLGRSGAVAHELTKARGRFRYEALKVCLKVADVALQCANQLIGKDLVFSLRLFDGLKGGYQVRLYPDAGEDIVTALEHATRPAAPESRNPSMKEGGTH